MLGPMTHRTLSTEQERTLKDQVIAADQPGSVLRDFGMLLSALEPNGFEASGKYHLIPLKLIDELDQRLSRPLKLGLKRPQLRSHPYLQALNLLLRASGLGRVEQTGTKARLRLDPAMKIQWDQLNPTEQYFNLLEAAFRLGRAEMVGEQERLQTQLLMACLIAWHDLPTKGHKYKVDRPDQIYVSGVGRDWYLLALMDLFGLIDIEHPRPPITAWHPAGLRRNSFGDAVLTLLGAKFMEVFHELPDDDEDDEAAWEPAFGVWQPLFQPYFPEWQRNLQFPSEEARQGIFVFRVSLGKDMWRLIGIPSESTLGDLADAILESVDFSNDHLFEFRYRDRFGARCVAQHPAMDEGPWVDEVTLSELSLEPGQSMTFLFDFGDHWEFDVKLERVEPNGRQNEVRILERHGKAPEQYPAWDE